MSKKGCSCRCFLVLAVFCAGAAAQGYQPPLLLAAPPPQPAIPSGYQPPLLQSLGVASAPSDSSAPLSSVPSALNAERTYGAHQQAVGSVAASEVEPHKTVPTAQDKDNKNDEYVVYYYYYYDNDTAANGNNNNNNLSLNFDDIPSLENYDERKDPSNDLGDIAQSRNASQPRSAPAGIENTVIRADVPAAPQPLKPVSNVFRYGSNEVPRFPVLPNFVLSETTFPPTTSTLIPTAIPVEEPSTTPAPVSLAEPEDDVLNNVLDSTPDLKDIKEEETTTTTTPEPTTTTEMPTTTTTTEKPRRRPSIGGGRRQFNSRPSSSSFNSNRNRSPSSSTTSTSTTTTTTSTPSTRRSFQGNRLRPRPSSGGFRGSASRTTESNDDTPSSRKASEATTVASTTTSRSRFTSSSRRFQSSRSSRPSSTSTTRAPASPVSRTTSRPRPNLITRNRPPRPGFLRPRPGSEPEEPSTTTTPAPVEEETSPEVNDLPSTHEEESEDTLAEEEEEEEEEEPTTTEANRFSALFRPRNRNALGNRPRPIIGNRPGRS
ncbi:uncharacterized protein TNIN_390061 [Trichonephila inaurata madagascariensis]|uniref:Uncharacterized protein n=1 Tax=Trichonephila inaurata madagascariensis TaxID=2747483 RepID=A0A8X6Y9J8_9ARAC|nr:uncharacterized protein TNIN_390061 [Trichonephila inaurata madagascariensis]